MYMFAFYGVSVALDYELGDWGEGADTVLWHNQVNIRPDASNWFCELRLLEIPSFLYSGISIKDASAAY